MTKRLLSLILFGGLLAAGMKVAPPVSAMPLAQVVSMIRDANGHYRYASATLTSADCSGLVSVAQSLAMGGPVHRLGDTHTLYAGAWPHAIPGATPADLFVIGANPGHMVALIDGVGIEARSAGQPFIIGPQARSPWSMQRQWHIDERVLVA